MLLPEGDAEHSAEESAAGIEIKVGTVRLEVDCARRGYAGDASDGGLAEADGRHNAIENLGHRQAVGPIDQILASFD